MKTIANFQKQVLEYKKLNDAMIELSIDDKLDASNELKNKLDRLNDLGKGLTEDGRSIANNIQFFSDADLTVAHTTEKLLGVISYLSHFIINTLEQDPFLSKSLKRTNKTFAVTVDSIDETIQDIATELHLLDDPEFQKIMEKIQQKLA